MPLQDEGVIPVDPIIPWQGCSSAEPASASPDINSVTNFDRRKRRQDKKLIVCLSNRLRTIPWKS